MPNLSTRRQLLIGVGALAVALPARAAPPRLVVLDAEISDDHDNAGARAAQAERVTMLSPLLRRELAAQGLYEVVDGAPAAGLIAQHTAQRASLRECDLCVNEIGRALDVDLVMVPWVFKVSELILMLNMQIYSVRAGRLVHMKGVQMRGNRDDSWERAARYLVRDMAERRAGNPAYGT